MLVRQREVRRYHISVRQLHVLRTIQELGSQATLSEVAKRVEREPHAISKQSVRMEKDGLIKRTKNTPKSNLLQLELTDKGLELANLAVKSELIDKICSGLSSENRQQLISMLQTITDRANKINSIK